MSIRVMTQVWDTSEQKGSALLLLLALADHAADDGFCWPGIQPDCQAVAEIALDNAGGIW